MKNTTKLILGMTVAAAAGAALGMLLAPQKGTDLQKRMKEEATDWLNNFIGILATGKELITKIKTKADQDAQEIRSELTETNVTDISNLNK